MMVTSPKFLSDSFIPLQSSNNNNRFSINTTNQGAQDGNNREDYGDVPWKRRSFYPSGIIGLHEEINEFYESMRPTETETEIRLRVVEQIQHLILTMWPQAKVEIFGSFQLGLFLPSSDIDLVVLGEWKNLPLSTLSTALKENGITSDITVLAEASVPIIRLVHRLTGIKVDISFNMSNGVKSAKIIRKLMKEYPPLKKLVFVLKQFLVQRGLNEVYSGGMSSYCLTLLIVSFLQGYYKPQSDLSLNLGTLLIEFFELYGINFNYSRVAIDIRNGGSYVPKHNPMCQLTVHDPLTEGNNIGRGTFLVRELQLAFQNAFHILHREVMESTILQVPCSSFLRHIVDVDKKVLSERHWMRQNAASLLKSFSDVPSVMKNSVAVDTVETENQSNAKKSLNKKSSPKRSHDSIWERINIEAMKFKKNKTKKKKLS